MPTLALIAILLLAMAVPARAAESEEGCAAFIDTVPATLATQGTWCLRHDLSTAIATGAAITVGANNVIVDCNGYKIGGLAAGPGSDADGIRALGRLNVTVRNCAIRGFRYGVSMSGDGHLVEDNLFDHNLSIGILVSGETGNLVRRNRVHDTGGKAGRIFSTGISVNGDIIDNTVAGVFATAANTLPNGIELYGDGTSARGNRVRDLVVAGTGEAAGITGYNKAQEIVDNHVTNSGPNGWAISGLSASYTICSRNQVAGFAFGGIRNCMDGGGNTGL